MAGQSQPFDATAETFMRPLPHHRYGVPYPADSQIAGTGQHHGEDY